MRRVPKLQEPLTLLAPCERALRSQTKKNTHEELEESDHADRAEDVRDCCHGCAEACVARIQYRSQKQGDEEEDK
jgi:hypothetical protein